tara:strand:+ start:2722 stop:3549 length:828 start_codon:yes stop_codon:yes gene_type:complete
LIAKIKYTTDSSINPTNFQNIQIISEVNNISMGDEWYEIAVDSHFWCEWRLRAMLKQVNQLNISIYKKLKVLDVGCGTAILRKNIESNTNWIVDAVDLNMDALSKVLPGRGRTMLYNIFDENDSLIELYDIVILFDVLEHINNTKPFLISLLKHLKPGGTYLINVPSLHFFYSTYDKKMGHFRRYNKKTLINEFNGFKVKLIDTRYWGFCLLPLLVIRSMVMFFMKNDEDKIIKRGFKPPNSMINRILQSIMRLETLIISKPPLGTSLLLAGKKE